MIGTTHSTCASSLSGSAFAVAAEKDISIASTSNGLREDCACSCASFMRIWLMLSVLNLCTLSKRSLLIYMVRFNHEALGISGVLPILGLGLPCRFSQNTNCSSAGSIFGGLTGPCHCLGSTKLRFKPRSFSQCIFHV